MAIALRTPADDVRAALTEAKGEQRDRLFRWLLASALATTLGILVVLLVGVTRNGFSVIADRGLDFVTSPLSLDPARAGLWQGVVGSLQIVFTVALVSFPLGIGAAVYLEEYAGAGRLTRWITVSIQNLAGVPSVVYGILGFTIFVRFFGPITGGTSVITAGLTLSALALPVVIIASVEAIRAVPMELRNASYGVGATRWEVIREQVLPYAAPGILTGTVLALLRAAGEAAPLFLVGAITGFFSTGDSSLVERLRGDFTALPMIIFNWAKQPGAEFRSLTSAAIIVLLTVLMAVNMVAIVLRNRYEKRRRG